ncbi:MAG: LemA family protein [Fimbriimonadales bacterium]
MGTGLLIFFGAILLLVIVAVSMYNGLVSLRQQATNAWAQIDVQLRRRHDLIPNLVETVKGYMNFEQETLEKVISARQRAVDAQGMRAQGQAESALTQAIGGLFAVAEAYPDLKANQNMLNLQNELSNTENQISMSRQFYNDSVMEYNTRREQFPSSMIANMFGFKPKELFEIDVPEVREPVKVSFT